MCAMIPMFRVLVSGYSRMIRSLPDPLRCSTLGAASATSIFLAGVATTRPRCSRAYRSSATGPTTVRPRRLPPVVSERAVRLRHLVHVLAPLHRDALAVRGVHQLGDEAVRHRVLLARAGVVDQPPQRERRAAVRLDLDRDLVVRATDPARLDLEHRAHVVHGLLQRDDRVVARALADDLEGL